MLIPPEVSHCLWLANMAMLPWCSLKSLPLLNSKLWRREVGRQRVGGGAFRTNYTCVTARGWPAPWWVGVGLPGQPVFIWRGLGQRYQGSGVRVGSLVQEKLGYTVVATVGGNVEGRQVVQGDVINGRLVLEQVLHTFHVVPLCSHVKWRQPILHSTTKPGHILVILSNVRERKAYPMLSLIHGN